MKKMKFGIKLYLCKSYSQNSSEMRNRNNYNEKEITVDKALKKYHQIDNVMVAILSFAFYAALLLFFIYNSFSSETTAIITFLAISVYAVLFGIFYGLLSPTFFFFIFWAFSCVRNVHELKKRLILLGHISENNIFFSYLENSTEKDIKYWKIRLKFAQEDIFEDDATIPEETVLYYSKKISIVIIMLMIPFFALGILILLFAVDTKEPAAALFGIFFLIMAIILGYFFGYKKLINREPQLILNDKGIASRKTGFHKWEEIEYVSIFTTIYEASLLFTGGKIEIHELNIKNNGIKLSKLLMVYRERNKLQINK
jgi:hypothetical protein